MERERTASPAAPALPGPVFLLTALAALLFAGWRAWTLRWTTDDAFISFRYARNLLDGLGLVFNAGERVEGYSNFLWMLWSAAGLGLGFEAEAWADFWGVACYLGCIALLALEGLALARRRTGRALLVPLAAVGAALHHEWNVFATGGLETSAFTFLLLAGYTLVVRGAQRPRLLLAAGAVFGAAALTRPDGVVPAAVAGAWLLLAARPRWTGVTLYGGAVAALLLPFLAWRLAYYGDLFPNTYYAKSADLTWYAQGWRYLLLYFEKYWALALGPLCVLVALVRARAQRLPASALDPDGALALAAALAATYAFYVVRVGGDFMFARLLMPVTPFLLLLLEQGSLMLFRERQSWGCALALAALAGSWLMPPPVTGDESGWRHGVANEWMYYSPERVAKRDAMSRVLRRYFEGLPVRVAFYGTQARMAYKVGFPVAIESHAGLTDAFVARLKLRERGRVGHEKPAPIDYLILKRKVHFTFSEEPQERLELMIPRVIVDFDEGVQGQVLHWDPALMQELARRGARFPDFLGTLDAYLRNIDALPLEHVAGDYAQIRRFYFAHVDDPAREAPFLGRLGKPGRAPQRGSAPQPLP